MIIADRRRTVKEWFYDTSRDIKIWWDENHEWAIVVLPIVGAGAIWVMKKVISGGIQHINLAKEQALKDLYIYDRSGGHYWKLRRKLSTREWTEFESRRKAGETISTILRDMRVI